jgi:hypothetical protein
MPRLDLDPLDERRVVFRSAGAVHALRDRPFLKDVVRRRLKQLRTCSAGQPGREGACLENHRYSVVRVAREVARGRDDHRAGFQRLARHDVLPLVPQSHDRDRCTVHPAEIVRLLAVRRGLPWREDCRASRSRASRLTGREGSCEGSWTREGVQSIELKKRARSKASSYDRRLGPSDEREIVRVDLRQRGVGDDDVVCGVEHHHHIGADLM